MKAIVYPLLTALLLFGALVSSDTRAAQPPETEEAPEQSEPKPPKRSEEPLETFVPSEKLPADSAISFPVDI
ncbi:MAG: hypothetical protein WBH85_07015 [Thermoanaerobaculia bacterium]